MIELQGLLAQQPCVLVTLSQIMGSAPRESGCRMIVSANAIKGSIGGGNLEFTAIAKARELLQEGDTALQLQLPFGLGPALNQCCGGAVNLHFERLPARETVWLNELVTAQAANIPAILVASVAAKLPMHYAITADSEQPADLPDTVWQTAQEPLQQALSAAGTASLNATVQQEVEDEDDGGHWWLELMHDRRQELLLFGAGHVGQEVAQRVRGLPFRLTWIDQRPDIFPVDAADHCLQSAADPLAVVAQARTDSVFVVMTHSHQLDEEICHAILQRDDADWDFAWLGLIGSDTKRKRFVHRLKQRGINELQLQRLVCPIGLAGIHGKQPATIALSLIAQLMMTPR
ncbi:MAG: xanthine dehydrogenase accessory protein XdhC [Xanthomonadales bacterium]|nr:xanthine dehydrogenase accessory protein XdhC [Xanthomonadales bacterium]